MMFAADPNADDLIAKLEEAIPHTKNIPSYEFHKKVKKMYNWEEVSRKIEKVYDKIIDNKPKNLLERFKVCWTCGPWSGICAMVIMLIDLLILVVLCWIQPAEEIEPAIKFNVKDYTAEKESFGDHNFNLIDENLPYSKDNSKKWYIYCKFNLLIKY